jgi:hypothetical protein
MHALTHTHTLVLAHKIGYCWKCYLTGCSIAYLPVWESRHPQLCLVAYITCSLNSWSIYFCLYFITVLLWPLSYRMSFGLRMLSKHYCSLQNNCCRRVTRILCTGCLLCASEGLAQLFYFNSISEDMPLALEQWLANILFCVVLWMFSDSPAHLNQADFVWK